METKLQVSTNKFPVPNNREDYYSPNDIQRRWEVMYDWKNKYYLTDDEREYFLINVNKGLRFTQIGELTLANSFKSIIPIHSKIEVDEYIENSKIPSPWRENASS